MNIHLEIQVKSASTFLRLLESRVLTSTTTRLTIVSRVLMFLVLKNARTRARILTHDGDVANMEGGGHE